MARASLDAASNGIYNTLTTPFVHRSSAIGYGQREHGDYRIALMMQ
jgi:hypothetical protein